MTRTTLAFLLLFLSLRAPSQDLAAETTIQIELGPADALLEGHGLARAFPYLIEFDGALYVWATSGDVDPILRVSDGTGKILAEDDDAGGGNAAFLEIAVARGDRLSIVAAADEAGSGTLALHVSEGRETEATREAARDCRKAGEEAAQEAASGDTSTAREILKHALDLVLAVDGGDRSPAVAGALRNLMSRAAAVSDLKTSRGARERAYAFDLRVMPPDHPDLLIARGNLAVARYRLGDLQGSRELLEELLAARLRTQPEDHPDVQTTRTNLSLSLASLGDLDGSRRLAERVLDVYSRTLPADHEDVQHARHNLAATLYKQGDLPGARELQEGVVEAYARTLPEEDPQLLMARANLAATLDALGDLQRARALKEKVLEIYSRTLPEDHPDLNTMRQNLSITLRKLGDVGAARVLCEEAVEGFSLTLPPDHPNLLKARAGLALSLRQDGDLEGARAAFADILEACSRNVPADHPDLQKARENLAVTERRLGRLEEARGLEEQVLEVRSRTMPPDHPSLQTARSHLAETLKGLGDLEGARKLEEEVLAVLAKTLPESHPDLGCARHRLVETLLALGEEARALEVTRDFQRWLSIVLDRAVLSSSREAEETVSHQWNHLSDSLEFSERLAGTPGAEELAREAFTLAENARAAGLWAAEMRNRLRGDPGSRELFDEAAAASVRLARAAKAGTGRAEYEAAVRRRDEAQRAILVRAEGTDAGDSLGAQATVRALAGELAPDQVFVGFWSYRRRAGAPDAVTPADSSKSEDFMLAHVLHADGSFARVELAPFVRIREAAWRWHERLRTSTATGPVAAGRGLGVAAGASGASAEDSSGVDLRKLVFDPLLPALRDKKRLVVALDGSLNAVPLEVLPAAESPALLGDHYEIQLRLALRRPSSRSVQASAEARAGKDGGTLVVIGAAAFDSRPLPPDAGETREPEKEAPAREIAPVLRGGVFEQGFDALPQTGVEAAEITALFEKARPEGPRAVLLEERRASTAAVVARAPDARWLHVATHGWFARESISSGAGPGSEAGRSGAAWRTGIEERVQGASPMVLCGLALAGANLPADSIGVYPGLVTAEEISGWDLSRCEMAVLSACETNLGEMPAGQGVASLQRGLHMAGARSVITSLWKVPDEATKELMIDFYRRIWIEKKPKARALWEAKLAMRRAVDEGGRPRYGTRDWAAWVLTGEPD